MANSTTVQSGERLRLALDMFEAGERIMRAQLRRRHPDVSEDEVEDLLRGWLRERPGAEFGDAVGRPVTTSA